MHLPAPMHLTLASGQRFTESTGNACTRTVLILVLELHRNFIVSFIRLYAAAHTTRGIMPPTSPGPYTMAGRATTTSRPGVPFTASSARRLASASAVHGFSSSLWPTPCEGEGVRVAGKVAHLGSRSPRLRFVHVRGGELDEALHASLRGRRRCGRGSGPASAPALGPARRPTHRT